MTESERGKEVPLATQLRLPSQGVRELLEGGAACMDRRVRGFGYVRICSIYTYLFVDLLVYYSYLGRFMPTPSALAKSTSFTVFAQPILNPLKP